MEQIRERFRNVNVFMSSIVAKALYMESNHNDGLVDHKNTVQ